jgi:hypothetical protein
VIDADLPKTPCRLRFCNVSEKWLFACTNRNMQPRIHQPPTTYSVQNSISDTLSVCPLNVPARQCRVGFHAKRVPNGRHNGSSHANSLAPAIPHSAQTGSGNREKAQMEKVAPNEGHGFSRAIKKVKDDGFISR